MDKDLRVEDVIVSNLMDRILQLENEKAQLIVSINKLEKEKEKEVM